MEVKFQAEDGNVVVSTKLATTEGLVNGIGTILGQWWRLRTGHTVIVQLLQAVIFRARIVSKVSL